MKNEYSRAELLKFLDYLAAKGLMKRATVHARKAASNNMLAILNEAEAEDLRHLDLDGLAFRFANLHGKKYTPKSLQVYKSRLLSALDDFLRYKENPATFRVGSSSRRARSQAPTGSPNSAQGVEAVRHAADLRQTQRVLDTYNVPVPIRTDVIVQLNGIPFDLSPNEAKKISNVILALAGGETG